ncbi:hypothetical protein [Clostridium perfringens]|uniref:hypothetical protein n=1 Tax=Clostridium perfringens TaxID=1502 RepID=UPI00396B22F1
MLVFNKPNPRPHITLEEFKYISCYCSTIDSLKHFINHSSLNTSYVSVQQNGRSKSNKYNNV